MRRWQFVGAGFWALLLGLWAAGCSSDSIPALPPSPPVSGDKTPIAGRAEVTVEAAKSWAASRGAHPDFLQVAALYWELAPQLGIRADVAYAQSAKETGFGWFTGVVPREFHNWCGLKTREGGSNDDPNAHARFPDDRTGVLAHLQHLAAYAGVTVRPPIVDPRYEWVIKGSALYVEDLGGRWAPSSEYGYSIVRDYLASMLRFGRGSSLGLPR